MKLGMNISLAWVIRIFALTVVVMMIVSFTQPWWIGRLGSHEAINIYGWGLRHSLSSDVASYISGDVTPTWQVALAWVYVGISGVVALLGGWIRKCWGSVILGVAGLGLIAYAYTAANVVVSNRLADYFISLEGVTVIGEGVIINAALQPGYAMAYTVGGLLAALAFIKAVASFITRKKAQDY